MNLSSRTLIAFVAVAAVAVALLAGCAVMPASYVPTTGKVGSQKGSACVFKLLGLIPFGDEMGQLARAVDDAGNPVNALYGFCRFIGDFMEQVTPEYVAVLFDESLSKSFRTEIYPAYKANRDPAPPELKRQFGQCRRFDVSRRMAR